MHEIALQFFFREASNVMNRGRKKNENKGNDGTNIKSGVSNVQQRTKEIEFSYFLIKQRTQL